MISLETMFQMQILSVGCVPNDTQLSGEICLSAVLSTVMVIDRVFFLTALAWLVFPSVYAVRMKVMEQADGYFPWRINPKPHLNVT